MSSLQQLKDAIDQTLTNLWPFIKDKQQVYFQSRGRYWQGIRNPSEIPADEVELPLDLSLCPTDQLENWAIFDLPLPSTLMASLQLDVYECLGGHGFVAIIWVWYQNRLYSRAQQVGPETWRTMPWRSVVFEEG